MDPRVGERSNTGQASDGERRWLAAFQRGDRTAFQPLLRPHLPALLALARRHCRDPHWAEDLLQETLVRAYRGLDAFRGDATVRTWVFRILVRLAGEPRRWRRDGTPPAGRGRGGAEPADLPLGPGSADVPDQLAEQPMHGAIERELQDRLHEAMERLTARQRTALHLRAVEGMDYAAIAGVLECSQVAARMHVLEARRKVMARLQEHLDP
jgi:RNA polymerase sigma-70 factor (ECF subfamily)